MSLISVLMRRDGLTRGEAMELIDECRDELISGNDSAIMDILGLEDDYMEEVLGLF